MPMAGRLPGRANGGTPVHARMLPEAPIFRRERGLDERLRDFAILDHAAERLVVRADGAQRPSGAIQELQFWNLLCEQRGWERHPPQRQTAREKQEPYREDSASCCTPHPACPPPPSSCGWTRLSRTCHTQHSTIRCWMLDVGYSMFALTLARLIPSRGSIWSAFPTAHSAQGDTSPRPWQAER